MAYPPRTACWFKGYVEDYPDDLLPQEAVVIVEIDGDGAYLVLRLSPTGFGIGTTRLAFENELMPMPAFPVPLWRLPPPYGTLGDFGPNSPNTPWNGPIW